MTSHRHSTLLLASYSRPTLPAGPRPWGAPARLPARHARWRWTFTLSLPAPGPGGRRGCRREGACGRGNAPALPHLLAVSSCGGPNGPSILSAERSNRSCLVVREVDVCLACPIHLNNGRSLLIAVPAAFRPWVRLERNPSPSAPQEAATLPSKFWSQRGGLHARSRACG